MLPCACKWSSRSAATGWTKMCSALQIRLPPLSRSPLVSRQQQPVYLEPPPWALCRLHKHHRPETIWCRSETTCPEPSSSIPDEHIARLANQLTEGALTWPYSCTGSGAPRRAAAPDAVTRGGAELALVTDLDLCSLYGCCRRLSTAWMLGLSFASVAQQSCTASRLFTNVQSRVSGSRKDCLWEEPEHGVDVGPVLCVPGPANLRDSVS